MPRTYMTEWDHAWKEHLFLNLECAISVDDRAILRAIVQANLHLHWPTDPKKEELTIR